MGRIKWEIILNSSNVFLASMDGLTKRKFYTDDGAFSVNPFVSRLWEKIT